MFEPIKDAATLTGEIYSIYCRLTRDEPREDERAHLAAFVSIAVGAYGDLQTAEGQRDFADDNEAMLAAARWFEGCSGAYLREALIEYTRAQHGRSHDDDAILLILLGVAASASRIGLQLSMEAIPTPQPFTPKEPTP